MEETSKNNDSASKNFLLYYGDISAILEDVRTNDAEKVELIRALHKRTASSINASRLDYFRKALKIDTKPKTISGDAYQKLHEEATQANVADGLNMLCDNFFEDNVYKPVDPPTDENKQLPENNNNQITE